MGRTDFSDQFRKIIICQKLNFYNLNIMRQSACLVITKITVDNFAITLVDRYDCPNLKLFILVGLDRSSFVCCLVHRGSTDELLLFQIFSGVVWKYQGSPTVTQNVVASVELEGYNANRTTN